MVENTSTGNGEFEAIDKASAVLSRFTPGQSQNVAHSFTLPTEKMATKGVVE